MATIVLFRANKELKQLNFITCKDTVISIDDIDELVKLVNKKTIDLICWNFFDDVTYDEYTKKLINDNIKFKFFCNIAFSNSSKMEIKCMDYGVDEYIVMSNSNDVINARIRRALNKTKMINKSRELAWQSFAIHNDALANSLFIFEIDIDTMELKELKSSAVTKENFYSLSDYVYPENGKDFYHPDDQKMACETISKKAVRDFINSGNVNRTVQYRIRNKQNYWIPIEINMQIQNGMFGEKHLYVYYKTISRDIRIRQIYEQSFKDDLDFIMTVDLKNDLCKCVYLRDYDEESIAPVCNYSENYPIFFTKHVKEDEVANLIKRFSIDEIKRTLKKEDHFRIQYSFYTKDGSFRKKGAEVFMFDEINEVAVIARKDITETYFKDQIFEKTKSSNNELIQIKNKLEETQKSMQSALSSVNIMYFEYFPDNHSALEFYGRKDFGIPHVMINYPDSWFEKKITLAEDEHILRGAFKEIDDGKKSVFCEVRNYLHGEYRWFRYYFTSIYNKGKRVKVACVAQDVTVQKDSEARYRQELYNLSNIDSNAIEIIRFDLTHDSYEVVGGMKEYLADVKPTGLYSEFLELLLNDFSQDETREKYGKVLDGKNLINEFKNGKTTTMFECLCSRDGQKIRMRRYIVNVVQNPLSGAVEGLMCVVDIQNQYMETAILQNITDEEFDFIATMDIITKETDVMYCGKYSRENNTKERVNYEKWLIDFILRNVIDEDKGEFLESISYKNLLEKSEKLASFSATARVFNKNSNSTLMKRITCSKLKNLPNYIVIRGFDVTDVYKKDTKQMNALREALNRAEAATEAKSTFLNNISHDMRTPLNGVIGFTDLALDADTIEEKNEFLKKIQNSGNFLLNLIQDTLDLSKIESNKVSLMPEPIHAKDLIQSIASVVDVSAKDKGVTLNVDYEKFKFENILVDVRRFQQIFVNLLSNAIKFTPIGGTVDFILENTADDKTDSNCRIIVRDNGIGMSKEFMPHAFEAFAQENQTEFTKQAGTGLGLSIVSNLISLMDGKINVWSEPNMGTEFEIYLKLKTVNIGLETRNNLIDFSKELKGKTVLLCEDHPVNMELAARLLEKAKINIITACDGNESLNKFMTSDEGSIDAILMDIRMPIMDGIEATEKIRSMNRSDSATIPIIAMTANAFENDRKNAADVGMNGYLIKPINPNEFYKTLYDCINIKNYKI